MSTTVVFDPPAEHHPWLWISDGNVVLSAVSLDKTRTILFRVHKSLLSDQSEVFASMFAMPQGPENEGSSMEQYDGFPLVRLPDAAEGLSALLSALRDTFPLYERSKFSDTPLRVRTALYLASKYLMNELRAKLIRIVEFQWPMTVEEFEERDMVLEQARKTQYVCEEWSLMFLPEPASAILLAEEFNIHSIIPAAYYDLQRCSVSKEWDAALKESCFSLNRGRKPARWNLLPRISLHKLLLLREHFESTETHWTYTVLKHDKSECEDKGRCREILLSIRKSISRLSGSKPCDPLFTIREIGEKLLESGLCEECDEYAYAQIRSVKEAIWTKLCEICYPSSQA